MKINIPNWAIRAFKISILVSFVILMGVTGDSVDFPGPKCSQVDQDPDGWWRGIAVLVCGLLLYPSRYYLFNLRNPD